MTPKTIYFTPVTDITITKAGITLYDDDGCLVALINNDGLFFDKIWAHSEMETAIMFVLEFIKCIKHTPFYAAMKREGAITDTLILTETITL